eukprot:5122880-Amphidinium_carterae.1
MHGGFTLLHAICESAAFTKEAAEVFSTVAKHQLTASVLDARNHAGATFFDVAAHAMNFWVLRFTLLNFPPLAKDFITKVHGQVQPPLACLVDRLFRCCAPLQPDVCQVASRPWQQDRCPFLGSLCHDAPKNGSPPQYADLAFVVEGHEGYVFAHRL